MILDSIKNYERYALLNDRLAKGFEYIAKTDFSQVKSGTYTIDNEDVFAIVQEYDTKEIADGKLEGHFKYVDIQHLIDGTELMGITRLTDQIPTIINQENDYAFYKSDVTFIKVEKGMFTVFFPEDLHMPCIKFNQSEKVKKVVVKVRVW